MASLDELLEAEVKDAGLSDKKFVDFRVENVKGLPIQDNGFDCGVFFMKFMEQSRSSPNGIFIVFILFSLDIFTVLIVDYICCTSILCISHNCDGPLVICSSILTRHV